MDQQESDFLAGALAIGDPELERRLLAGFHLVRAGCRIADGEPVDLAACVAASRAQLPAEDVAADDRELAALAQVRAALAAAEPDRRAVHWAFIHYARELGWNSAMDCSLAVFALVERLWTEGCDPLARLEAGFRYTANLALGLRPLAECRELPLIHAQRARAARSRQHIGIARSLRATIVAHGGNFGAGMAQAQRLLEWARRHDDRMVHQRALALVAMLHGRMGQPVEAARYASQAVALASPDDPSESLNALPLLANALIDLGLLDEARKAFELASLHDARRSRQLALLGLMDVALRSGDATAFNERRRRLEREHLVPAMRLLYLRDAAIGLARFDDVAGARELLEQARQLARSAGFGHDYMLADGELERLAAPPRTVPRAASRALAPELAALHAQHGRASALLAQAMR